MQILEKLCQLVLAVALVGVSSGAAHANYSGESGDIVYAAAGSIKKFRLGAGTAPVVLAAGAYPAVSPSGKKIAYSSGMAWTQQERLYVMNMDGTGAVDVGPGSMPAWSPDGTKLAYLDLFPAAGKVKGLYINPLNGQPPTLVAAMNVTQPLSSPWIRVNWSSSTSHNYILVFASNQQFGVDANTGQVTAWGSSAYRQAAYGPEGNSIIQYSTYTTCIEQATVTLYCSDQPGGLQFPTFSPDRLTAAWYIGTTQNQLQYAAVFPTGPVQVAINDQVTSFDWARVPHSNMGATLAGGQWSDPIQLTGDIYSLQTAVAVMPDNGAMGDLLKQMVSIGGDGRVYHRALTMNNTWTPFAVVPGLNGDPGGIPAKRVAIAGAMDGSAQVVIVAFNDVVYHAMRSASGAWSGFNQLNGYAGASSFAARDVAIAITGSAYHSPGFAQVTVNGLTDGNVFHRMRSPEASWTDFAPVAGVSSTLRLAMASAPNGDAYVLATNFFGSGVQRQLRHAGGSWDSWVSVANAPALNGVSLAIGLNTAGQQVAKIAYLASDGHVSYQQRENATSASAWTASALSETLMSNGRSVSVTNAPTGADLMAVQAQPQ